MRRHRPILLTVVVMTAIVGSMLIRRESHEHAGEVHHSHGEARGDVETEKLSEREKKNRAWVRRGRSKPEASHTHPEHCHAGDDQRPEGDHHHHHGTGTHSHVSILGWEITVWDPGSMFYFSADNDAETGGRFRSTRSFRDRGQGEQYVGMPSLLFREGQMGSWFLNSTFRRVNCPASGNGPDSRLVIRDDRVDFCGLEPPTPPPRHERRGVIFSVLRTAQLAG